MLRSKPAVLDLYKNTKKGHSPNQTKAFSPCLIDLTGSQDAFSCLKILLLANLFRSCTTVLTAVVTAKVTEELPGPALKAKIPG